MQASQSVKENLLRVKGEIGRACAASGRSQGEISVLGATKSQPVEKIKQAVECGLRICGENYSQEAERKISELGRVVEWHFIGHLQTNKAKKAAQMFDLIQTVDSAKLAAKLNDAAPGRILPILIEVNIGEEPQKSGVMPMDVPGFARSLSEFKNLEIQGLMCMPPLLPAEQTRQHFKKTFSLFQQLKTMSQRNVNPKTLSMGMSGDFPVAVEEGSTMVRIGTALFGERKE